MLAWGAVPLRGGSGAPTCLAHDRLHGRARGAGVRADVIAHSARPTGARDIAGLVRRRATLRRPGWPKHVLHARILDGKPAAPHRRCATRRAPVHRWQCVNGRVASG